MMTVFNGTSGNDSFVAPTGTNTSGRALHELRRERRRRDIAPHDASLALSRERTHAASGLN
jgi:hypothetical protein